MGKSLLQGRINSFAKPFIPGTESFAELIFLVKDNPWMVLMEFLFLIFPSSFTSFHMDIQIELTFLSDVISFYSLSYFYLLFLINHYQQRNRHLVWRFYNSIQQRIKLVLAHQKSDQVPGIQDSFPLAQRKRTDDQIVKLTTLRFHI
jgi:hypothetical protein